MEGFLPNGVELFPRLERVGRFLGRLLTRHQLASHGDHFVHDKPVQEQLPLYDDMGNYTNFYDGADVSTWPPYEPPTSDPYAPNGFGSAERHAREDA